MADLVDEDGEQVHASVGWARGVCCGAEIRQGLRELGMLARGRVDEPAEAGGGGIERDGQAVGVADLAAGEIGDADLQIGEAIGIGGGRAGLRPGGDRLRESFFDLSVGQGCRGGRRARLDRIVRVRNQRVLDGESPPFLLCGGIGEAQVIVVQRLRCDESRSDGVVGRRTARALVLGNDAGERMVAGSRDRRAFAFGRRILSAVEHHRGARRERDLGARFGALGGGRKRRVGRVVEAVLSPVRGLVIGAALPAFRPRYGDRGIRCCTAVTVAVRGRDFGAGCGVDFLDDDRDVDPDVGVLVVDQRAVNLAEQAVCGEQDPRLERFEKELGGRGRGAGKRLPGAIGIRAGNAGPLSLRTLPPQTQQTPSPRIPGSPAAGALPCSCLPCFSLSWPRTTGGNARAFLTRTTVLRGSKP
ncbi:MAG TPA: hypothetical protein VF211_03550 [Burkholderiales bacterium]